MTSKEGEIREVCFGLFLSAVLLTSGVPGNHSNKELLCEFLWLGFGANEVLVKGKINGKILPALATEIYRESRCIISLLDSALDGSEC